MGHDPKRRLPAAAPARAPAPDLLATALDGLCESWLDECDQRWPGLRTRQRRPGVLEEVEGGGLLTAVQHFSYRSTDADEFLEHVRTELEIYRRNIERSAGVGQFDLEIQRVWRRVAEEVEATLRACGYSSEGP